ncbi:hypothetical protein GQ55_4G039000 [Panicum hallii var. hallii]|uniref:Uncharacterized protein n=1 Tax=Panicum hallii var. hallii TaxID=1504633 RepID=A0A2T7DV20_9POAL|nr:hypothetical protein GQ55_4G039000 [Panicum hallii var. hallii]
MPPRRRPRRQPHGELGTAPRLAAGGSGCRVAWLGGCRCSSLGYVKRQIEAGRTTRSEQRGGGGRRHARSERAGGGRSWAVLRRGEGGTWQTGFMAARSRSGAGRHGWWKTQPKSRASASPRQALPVVLTGGDGWEVGCFLRVVVG